MEVICFLFLWVISLFMLRIQYQLYHKFITSVAIIASIVHHFLCMNSMELLSVSCAKGDPDIHGIVECYSVSCA